ncbi:MULTISPECIES: hypothetical protein, partial [unclassified Endozoicomonas]
MLQLPLLTLSLVCQGEPLTRRLVLELEQKTVFPNQSFSIRTDRHTSPGNPSGITNKNGYAGSNPSPEKKQQRPHIYELKTTIIELISWKLLYSTNLMVDLKPILTTNDPPLSSTSYPWLSIEVVVAVGLLLKSYWNPDSPLFKPIQQQETSQNHPYSIITMVLGSGDNQTPYQSPKSSRQRATGATTQSASSLSIHLYSGSGGSNGGSQQHSHTLGFNCFAHPCHGVCQFRPSSDSVESVEPPLNSLQSPSFEKLDDLSDIELRCVCGVPYLQQPHDIVGSRFISSNFINRVASYRISPDEDSTDEDSTDEDSTDE